jgi:hypothetical protein
VAQVRVDEMGRQAWDRVAALRVEHRGGSGLSVQWESDGLTVHADLAAALPRALDGELLRKISALL